MNNMFCKGYLFMCMIIFAFALFGTIVATAEVIWAVNCGGDTFVDSQGIQFQRDTNPLGTASDFGRSLNIARCKSHDQPLYQTERYHTDSFSYEIPVSDDGNYVLVLKFSEVWFTASNQKVFDVLLNQRVVVDQLDIYHRVGRGVAHDEYVPFTIKDRELHLSASDVSKLESSSLNVEFAKGDKDNPKINAMYVIRGTLDDVAKLPPMPGEDKPAGRLDDEEEEDDDDELRGGASSRRKVEGQPRVQDPYAADDTGSMMLPVVIAIAAFIPIVFCLCRL